MEEDLFTHLHTQSHFLTFKYPSDTGMLAFLSAVRTVLSLMAIQAPGCWATNPRLGLPGRPSSMKSNPSLCKHSRMQAVPKSDHRRLPDMTLLSGAPLINEVKTLPTQAGRRRMRQNSSVREEGRSCFDVILAGLPLIDELNSLPACMFG
jgi:hypothetical protein